jgi:hypothetical protein
MPRDFGGGKGVGAELTENNRNPPKSTEKTGFQGIKKALHIL